MKATALLTALLSILLAGCELRGKPAKSAVPPAAPKPVASAAPAPAPLPALSIPQTRVELPKPQPVDPAALETEATPPEPPPAVAAPAPPPPRAPPPARQPPPPGAPPSRHPATRAARNRAGNRLARRGKAPAGSGTSPPQRGQANSRSTRPAPVDRHAAKRGRYHSEFPHALRRSREPQRHAPGRRPRR